MTTFKETISKLKCLFLSLICICISFDMILQYCTQFTILNYSITAWQSPDPAGDVWHSHSTMM